MFKNLLDRVGWYNYADLRHELIPVHPLHLFAQIPVHHV